MSRTVITYGTFDLFHVGHLRLLKRMQAIGDRVIVGVSTDEFNRAKGKRALIPYDERKEIVESLSCVDMVIPEEGWDQKADDIRRFEVDTFVMGDDWRGKFDHLQSECEVVYLERTFGISSSALRSALGRLLESHGAADAEDVEILDCLRRSLP